MRLFIDASVALAAAVQHTGASRAILERAQQAGWELLCSRYVLREIATNLRRFPPRAAQDWPALEPRLTIVRDLTTFDYPVVFPVSKDRPVLFTAAGWPMCSSPWIGSISGRSFALAFTLCEFRCLATSSLRNAKPGGSFEDSAIAV